MGYVDLHIHSNYSDDGEFYPNELVDLCLEKGIKYFSIADHNSTKGIAEAKEYCKDKDITIITAIELDCTIDGVNLHLLGYGVDYKSGDFEIIEDNGGVPVLAHPGNNVKENRKLLEKIIETGARGLEVYSSYHNERQTAFYKDFAINNNCITTCGSDFHGKTKPSISIGGISCVAN